MYANDFYEITTCLKNNSALKTSILSLIDKKPILGKSVEGKGREDTFKTILKDAFEGKHDLSDSYLRVEAELSPSESAHNGNARVFPSSWGERLLRTQMSRFYNQAVLEYLVNSGIKDCFIPHSENEATDSKCTMTFAGKNTNVDFLLNQIIENYDNGNYTKEIKIPNHPHCTHVVKPI